MISMGSSNLTNAGHARRICLLSTDTEPRGLFLIEHPSLPRADYRQPTTVVTMVQVSGLTQTMARAQAFGPPFSKTELDVTH